MTQYGYEPLSPSDSGSTLLERVNGVVPALVTNHKGPARPGYVQPGMMWIDDSGSEWLLNLYDGAGDVAIAAIDPETHQALSQWVPATRTIASGLGVKINGGDSATLAGTVTIGLDLATDAETVAGEIGNKPAAPTGVHAAIAAALAGFSAGGPRNIRGFTTSGVYTPSEGVTKALVIVTGGGGGGYATQAGGSVSGGGAGATAIALINGPTPQMVTIGAGGANAGDGGTTSFGALVTAAGGSHGTYITTGGIAFGGAGGSTTTRADVALVGGAGGHAFGTDTSNQFETPGSGGSSFWGGRGAYGAGGSGSNGTGFGYLGSAGVVVVLEY